jgi:hypothetical protein
MTHLDVKAAQLARQARTAYAGKKLRRVGTAGLALCCMLGLTWQLMSPQTEPDDVALLAFVQTQVSGTMNLVHEQDPAVLLW